MSMRSHSCWNVYCLTFGFRWRSAPTTLTSRQQFHLPLGLIASIRFFRLIWLHLTFACWSLCWLWLWSCCFALPAWLHGSLGSLLSHDNLCKWLDRWSCSLLPLAQHASLLHLFVALSLALARLVKVFQVFLHITWKCCVSCVRSHLSQRQSSSGRCL